MNFFGPMNFFGNVTLATSYSPAPGASATHTPASQGRARYTHAKTATPKVALLGGDKMRIDKNVLLCACAGFYLANTGVSFGQSFPADPTDKQKSSNSSVESAKPNEDSAIADIVVTARRRAESLQTTPVTVTAFSGEAL